MVRPTGPITFDAPIMGDSIPLAIMDTPFHADVGLGPMVPYSAVQPHRTTNMSVDIPFIWRPDTRPRPTAGFDAERDRPIKYYSDNSFGRTPVYPYNTQGSPKLPRNIGHGPMVSNTRKPSWFHGTAQEWHAAIGGGRILD